MPADDPPRLRRASRADVDAITRLVHDAYVGYTPLLGRTPIPMTVDYGAALEAHELWVLDAGDALVGVLELLPEPDLLWIENVAVQPALQGRGHGRTLLRFAEEQARSRGLAALGLLTNERYLDDIAMYEHYGYRETRREPYGGTDLVHFRKILGPGTA
jgi:N-acetylglutamate synthase-like GNAT family acetyltransferase